MGLKGEVAIWRLDPMPRGEFPDGGSEALSVRVTADVLEHRVREHEIERGMANFPPEDLSGVAGVTSHRDKVLVLGLAWLEQVENGHVTRPDRRMDPGVDPAPQVDDPHVLDVRKELPDQRPSA